MNKLLYILLLAIVPGYLFAQQDIFMFKKKSKTISLFRKGSYIAFQLEDKQWVAGNIAKVQHDSFYLKPLAIHYSFMHVDTLSYEVIPFAIKDIYAMPKKGVQIDYVDGHFQIITWGGHMHWYWIKSGWIFRVVGAGYAALYVINGLVQNNLSLKGSGLGIAAGVFLFGEILKLTYKPTLRVGSKYHFEYYKVSD